MKKFYILKLMAMLLSGIVNAQIVQVTDINTSGASGIADPFLYNGSIYFEADDGSSIGDELYRLAADATVSLFKNINQDPEDTTPNSDPKAFIIYKGLLYFTANDGDNTGNDAELWVTDGTPANTRMVYDIQPGVNKGSNPQQFFVFNDFLYFMANDGSSTQWWRYDGINDPVKVTNLNDGGFATPVFPIIDEANNRVFFQANNGRNELHVMYPDESIDIIDINPSNHGYTGSEAILFNGNLIFQGDNGTDGDELWISDGTIAGTSMLLDINTGIGDSNPESFEIYNGKVYFAAEAATGIQLWETDGTTAGTKMVVEPLAGGNGNVAELYVFNGKLYFSATDGTNGVELWAYDGASASMRKDINTAGDGNPAGFMEVNGIMFFEANDGTATKLWMTDGTIVVTVAAAFEVSEDPVNVNSEDFVVSGSKLFFTADDASGDEFFMVDAGKILSKIGQSSYINPTEGAGIASPYVFNGTIYFEADDGSAIGDELYIIGPDGVASLLKDINQDPEDTTPNSDPKAFIPYNGLLYFTANDGDNTGNDAELWVTDGTPENTRMVYDIQPGVNKGSNPQQFFVFNNLLYFMANDGSSTQWWKYDGVNNPVKVTNLNDGGFATPVFPIIDEANNRVFFQANNGRNELHVMYPDESIDIIDINPTNHGYTGSEAILYNGKLIFQGDNGTDGDELWISDGTIAGTSMLLDINAGTGDSNPESFAIYNGKVYFAAEVATGIQLWETDGTTAGTKMVAEPFAGGNGNVADLYVYNGKLYFSATNGTDGVELWVYDGNNASMFKNINPSGDGVPYGFLEVNGLLFFEANDGIGLKLWVSDGTPKMTLTVAKALNTTIEPLNVNADEFAVVGPLLYYTADAATGDEFFVVDTREILVKIDQATDINPTGGAGIASPYVYKGAIYFEADDGSVIGDELYRIAPNGNTTLFKDINQDPADTSPNSDPKDFIEYNGLLYFNANDGDNTGNDAELWVTDGTPENTHMVYDLQPGVNKGGNPQHLFVFNNLLYFQANDGTSTQWWKYDAVNDPMKVTNLNGGAFATPSYPVVDEANGRVFFQASNGRNELHVMKTDETVDIIDINPSNHGYTGQEAILFNGNLIFQGDNGTDGDELWISDGTLAGTSMLLDINSGAGDSNPESFAIYSGKVYFAAETSTGIQLWETDGTTAGTKMVAEPFTGGDGDVANLYVYNGKLYFSATDGTNGVELWMYDGSTASMLKDINPASDGNPYGFLDVDGLMFFEANDGGGLKLWVSDGTAERTMTVADALNANVDPLNVNADEFAVVGTLLYYTADDANGDEFFVVDASKIFAWDVIFSVTDGTDPLEGVEVNFEGITLLTGADGKATFEYFRAGTDLPYTLTKEGFPQLDGIVTIVDKDVFEEAVLSLATMYSVTFNLTDGTNALEGASVTFNGNTLTTDATGTVKFENVVPATGIDYSVSLAGYNDASGTVDVSDMDVTTNVTLVLTTYSVTFSVTDGTDPLSGASVTFNGSTLSTGADGNAVFTDVTPADGQSYTVSLVGYEDATGSLNVTNADVTENISLTFIVYNVTFTVTDGTNPLAGASVSFGGNSVLTDSEGKAVFADIAPATGLAYSVTLSNFIEATGTVDVDGDEAVSVTLIHTGIGNMNALKLKVYPNPATEYLVIEGELVKATYTIYDIRQRVVKEESLTGNTIELDLKPGYYFLHVRSEGKLFVEKIVIQ